MDIRAESLRKHYEWNGKIEVVTRCKIEDRKDLSLAYTPGVAQPCLEIQAHPDKSYELTRRSNLVAVITDGTAVLGLGDIGPEPTFARVHAQNILADLFADASKPDAGRLFDSAMSEIAREGRGALVYVSLPDSGLKLPEGVESPAGVRNYGMGAQILRALGFKQIKLLTSHVGAHALSDGFGLKIVSEKELK